jgi:hypothetical protein
MTADCLRRLDLPRDIQLRERAPDVTGSTASRLSARADGEGSRAPAHRLGRG